MKYLLAAIDARRQAVRLDDAELRKLLSDVRRAKDERAEMTEAMDRLLTELRGSEHSQAFNSKVSKRDAPDYADIVKTPMDLGTMQRNVRAGKYRTKAAFARDLELIWSNCELYNSVGHVLRRSAAIMRAKARHLLAYVHEGDEVGEALRLWEKRSDAAAVAAGTGAGAKGKGKSKDLEDAVIGPGFSRLPLSLPLIPQPGATSASSSSLSLPLADRPALTRSAGDMARFLELESLGLPRDDASGSGSGSRVREESARLVALAAEEAKTVATPGPLTLALGPRPKDAPGDIVAQGDEAWWNMSSSSFLTAGVSQVPASVRLPIRTTESRNSGGTFGGQRAIRRNVKTIAQLRHTTSKFVALANHTDTDSPLPAWLASTSSDEEDEKEEDESSMPIRTASPKAESKAARRRRAAGPPPLESGENPFARVNASGARQGVQDAAKTLLAHSGFDGVNGSCLDVLTDIASEYLENLGRTLRLYADRYAHEMSVEELVLHTLRENGGASVASLETYVVDDVERYGGRLEDMLRRNRAAYRERLNTSVVPMADEAFFQPGNDALVNGGFAEELGDDFFGFKAMGLDAETGMAGLTVPARLFKAKANAVSRTAATDGASDEAKVLFPPPPPHVRLSESSVGAQIGLLQPWYRETLRTRGRWRSFAVNSDDERAERAAQSQARAGTRPRSRSRMLSASVAPPDSDSGAGEVILSDDEQERQRFKVGPTGRMPKREMAPAPKMAPRALVPKKRARAT